MRLGRGQSLPEEFQPEKCYRESIRIAEGIGSELDRARTLRDWAAAESARGQSERAVTLRAEALSLFQKMGMDLEVERMEKA